MWKSSLKELYRRDILEKIPIIVIAGPTASGKTVAAVELAKKMNTEIISADSMQIYKGLSITTAKPDKAEMQGIVHHLMDFLELEKKFSVADYVTLAKEKIQDIYSRGKVPIVCGGTGLYISSLIEGVKFDDTGSDENIRKRLEKEALEKGNHYLWEKLREIDPETAEKVHENNLPRVIRGLEVYELTGEKLSYHKENSKPAETPFDVKIIGLTAEDRQFLYDRINKRVDIMLENGMIEECREVYDRFKNSKFSNACQAIGYKELIPYFEGHVDLDECIGKIKQESRRYAKRQLTWFRRVPKINWIKIDKCENSEKILEKMQNIIAK